MCALMSGNVFSLSMTGVEYKPIMITPQNAEKYGVNLYLAEPSGQVSIKIKVLKDRPLYIFRGFGLSVKDKNESSSQVHIQANGCITDSNTEMIQIELDHGKDIDISMYFSSPKGKIWTLIDIQSFLYKYRSIATSLAKQDYYWFEGLVNSHTSKEHSRFDKKYECN